MPVDTYGRDNFSLQNENCFINFDENILISCEGGLTLIDRLDSFLNSEERSVSSYIIVNDLQINGAKQSVFNNELFTSYSLKSNGYISYKYEDQTHSFEEIYTGIETFLSNLQFHYQTRGIEIDSERENEGTFAES